MMHTQSRAVVSGDNGTLEVFPVLDDDDECTLVFHDQLLPSLPWPAAPVPTDDVSLCIPLVVRRSDPALVAMHDVSAMATPVCPVLPTTAKVSAVVPARGEGPSWAWWALLSLAVLLCGLIGFAVGRVV